MSLNVDINFGKAVSHHFVSLQWLDRTPGERAAANGGAGTPMAVSGFIVSISDRWFLITAGHILKDIDHAMKKGQFLEEFRLSDGYSGGIGTFPPIPFSFFDSKKWYSVDDAIKSDYGCIYLRPNIASLLSANGIEALSEEAWQDDLPERFDEVYLAGIPASLCFPRQTQNGIKFRTTFTVIGVDPCKEKPDCVSPDDMRLIYKISPLIMSTGQQLLSLDGMSGCPLFGVQFLSHKKHRYWLIGIQSAEIPRNDVVEYALICPFKPFGKLLQSAVQK